MATVQDLIADARTYSNATLTDARNALNQAMVDLRTLGGASAATAAGAVVAPWPGGIVPNDPQWPADPGPSPHYLGPYYQEPVFEATPPTFLAIPQYISPPEPGEAPTVATPVPQDKPQGPAADVTLLQGAPVLNPADFTLPNAPDLLAEIRGIAPPAIVPITVPAAPDYVDPGFAGVRPVDPGEAPANLDATLRSNFLDAATMLRTVSGDYVDAFLDREFPAFRTGMAAIESRLSQYLAGGSALKPEIETAMFQRALDKNEGEYRRARRTLHGNAARAGFTLPPISLLNQSKDLDQERRNSNARTTNEILIKQAELEQNNLQFAVQAASSLRQVAVTAALSYFQGMVQINGQALDYARATVEYVVKSYEVAVRHAEIQARLYEAEAGIYQARIRGALGVIEAYNATVQGLEAQSNVNRAQVDEYKARIEAVSAEAQIFEAQAKVVSTRADIARTLVDVYQAKVQAYAAQVNARTAEWQGFAEATRGETARVEASVAQVKAFQVKVEAYSAEVQAKLGEIESIAKINETEVRRYQAEVEAYRARVQGEAESTKASIDSFGATIEAYRAEVAAVTAKSQALIAWYEQKLRATNADANLAMERARLWQQLDITRATGLADISTSAAQLYANTAQAALSGMNALAAQTENTAL